jgi:hypothetical protein
MEYLGVQLAASEYRNSGFKTESSAYRERDFLESSDVSDQTMYCIDYRLEYVQIRSNMNEEFSLFRNVEPTF